MVKTLFIGLDGATFTLLDDLFRDLPGEGVTMPFLSGLVARGAHAKLRSTPNPLTPPAWVSLMTGRSPGHHGVYDFVRFEDKGDEVYFTLYDSRDIRVETIWSIASNQGSRVVCLNFPMMSPTVPVNGSVLPGFTSWKHLRVNSYPASLYERVKAIPGFNPQELAWDFQREGKIGYEMSQQDMESWVIHHMPREQQWFHIAETLLREDQPEFFAVMFDGTDKIQHQTWHVLDPRLKPKVPDEAYLRLRKLSLDYYRALDGYIARLVELAGPEAQVFLASDHGFTASTHVVRINNYLADKGYLQWAAHENTDYDRKREEANFAFLDWSKTLAFCPTPSSNGIYIRVARQSGQPGVEPSEYASFRQKLIDDLLAWKLPDGRAVMRSVTMREEAFPGAAMGEAPDLLLTLFDDGFVSVRNREPAVVPRNIPFGTHHPEGVFIASGPGVRPSAQGEMSILDVPSILLHSLGLQIPDSFEGRVPEELFSEEYLQSHPVRLTQSHSIAATASGDEGDMPEAEKQQIMEQLRALGYLED